MGWLGYFYFYRFGLFILEKLIESLPKNRNFAYIR